MDRAKNRIVRDRFQSCLRHALRSREARRNSLCRFAGVELRDLLSATKKFRVTETDLLLFALLAVCSVG
ncbi:MAG: hypothetical protein LBS09_06050 [Bacteroidales bacterium]|jgi:hypothetical protein|nr:hypothetical protein [Bacteroidales bacterium]